MLPYVPESGEIVASWEAHGFPCAIIRQPRGHFCGYVGVPVEHPAHGFEESIHEVSFADVPRWPHRRWRIQEQLNALPLTYAKGNRENLHWWFGQDWFGQDPSLEQVTVAIEVLAAALRNIK